MMTIGQIKKALQDRNKKEVARLAGVAYSAIRKLSKGQDNISLRTAQKLSDYLEGGNNANIA